MDGCITITLGEAGGDAEIEAIRYVAGVIEAFDYEARARILDYVRDRYVTADARPH